MTGPDRPRRRSKHAPVSGEVFESVEAFAAVLEDLRRRRLEAETHGIAVYARLRATGAMMVGSSTPEPTGA